MKAHCSFRQATRQRRPPPEKGVKMVKSRDRRRCAPKDDDGGDEKEAVYETNAEKNKEKSGKKNSTPPRPPEPAPIVEQQWFRCKNSSCQDEWLVPANKVDKVDECPGCGSNAFEKIGANQAKAK